ncbi:hypothetical protein PIB30_041341 [Stylosanthes scabra]|uniref:Uncharacterized protein n=1 Tax=Stylosanthes scabra TaxID=79078 RepID=A0ABU6XDN2_9FABA|nr:hypothetical protein [Stylosanthes scabra]
MVNGTGKRSKKGKATKPAPANESKPKKDVRISTFVRLQVQIRFMIMWLQQGHDFRCVPKSVAVIFDKCLNNDLEKRAVVDELGFGVFSHLTNYYLKQKVLKQIYNRFDTYDNTIHTVAGEVEITTEKIGKALGLTTQVYPLHPTIKIRFGTTYDDKVTPKELSEENHNVYKFFQSKTQAALSSLIFNTTVDTEENRNLFKRAFLLYIQKCFLLPTSAPNVTPRALPTIFDLENTRNKNWALHVHNFLWRR